MCWEAIRAQGGVVEGGVDGVFEASEEFGVRWVAQCGGQLLDGCGVVVLLVSIRVRRVLGPPQRADSHCHICFDQTWLFCKVRTFTRF